MRFTCVILSASLLVMSGCGQEGIMNITKLPVSDETVIGLSGDITDTSVQKEALYSKMRTDRDKAQAKMYAQSGFHVQFEMQEVSPGVKVQVMKDVSFKETPRFDQPLPNGPSIHPGWKVAERVVEKTADTVLAITGINAVKDVVNSKIDAAQPKYYGSYNPQTAQPYIVEPTVITVP